MAPERTSNSIVHRTGALQRPWGRLEAGFYEAVAARAVDGIVIPVIDDQLRGSPSGAVLDVGCGSGTVAEHIRLNGRQVIGVDPSFPQLRRLGRTTAVPAVAATAGALAFRTAAFGTVVSSCAIKHWPDRARGISECVRVLRPGGLLVLIEIDGGRDDHDLLRFAAMTRIPPGLRRPYRWFARHTFVPLSPTPEELLAECGEAGAIQLRTWRLDGLPFFVVTGVRGT